MNRFSIAFLTLLIVFVARPSWGQRTSSTNPSTGSSTNSPRGNNPLPSSPSANQIQGPLYVGGRVLMESGQPVPESISVELSCGMRPLQVIHTDLGGYFTFTLGTSGVQSNMDYSASNENPLAPAGTTGALAGTLATGSVTGCDLRVSVPGYYPLTYTLSDRTDMGRVEVGTLQLRKIAGVEGSSISVTSLLVPSNARKEYEKGQKELRGNHPDPAKQHLEKAVAEYDKFAAAWNQLGEIYLNRHDADQARNAFQKAIAADPQYIPPFLNLASLAMQNQQYDTAVEMSAKALELDPSIGYASFMQAVADFNLNRFDEAEKSAKAAEKNAPGASMPQLHALLANIYFQREDYPSAAAQIRAYLREAPRGQLAEQMKKDLEQIEQGKPVERGEAATPTNSAVPQ